MEIEVNQNWAIVEDLVPLLRERNWLEHVTAIRTVSHDEMANSQVYPPGTVLGQYNGGTGEIVLYESDDNSSRSKVDTLLHELGHCLHYTKCFCRPGLTEPRAISRIHTVADSPKVPFSTIHDAEFVAETFATYHIYGDTRLHDWEMDKYRKIYGPELDPTLEPEIDTILR